MMQARSYQGLHDLDAMLEVLTLGQKVNNGTHYIHRGDLQWWLFYNDDVQDVWHEQIRLWFEGKVLLGWALLSPSHHAFDVFTLPELRGDQREHEMLTWAMDAMAGVEELENGFVDERDEVRVRWLAENGFARIEKHLVYFSRSLADLQPAPALPNGFSMRTSRGVEDARLRSVASYAAFGARKPFEEYLPRTVRFMQSPVYVPEHEVFVLSPEGQVASYCIVWTDEDTKLGHFEPVGTHPDFQRKGLGRRLLLYCLNQLKREGMTDADVCTYSDNEAAIRLYESVGFQITKKLYSYQREKKNFFDGNMRDMEGTT